MTRGFRAAPWFLASLSFAPAGLAATAFAPPGPGQGGLAVGTDARGVLRAAACAGEPCRLETGIPIEVPSALRAGLSRARLSVVGLGQGRRAIVVSIPGASGAQGYEAVIAMPPGGKVPRVVFQGLTGLVEGPDGVRQGKRVSISEPDERGARVIVVGDEREDLNLCGRPAVLSPTLLHPDDLTLRPARVQRLTPSDRERATAIAVAPVEGPATGTPLRALGASSALGTPWGLSDGDAGTSWAENRGGAGRGEFNVLSAPAELPISGFDLVVSGPAGARPRDVPRELWLVTRGEVFSVTLPADAATRPAQRYRASLPKPVRTDCVALVIESAFDEQPDSRVAIAELSAVTEFEGQPPQALVAALAGGAERARAAGAALRALGAPGYAAIAGGFDGLDAAGRSVALGVIDSAPCDVSAPIYVRALGSGVATQVQHARDRLQRCADAATPALVNAVAGARGEQLLPYATALATLAPARAIDVLTPRLARLPLRERRALRVLVARAAQSPEAMTNVRAQLADAALPPAALLDLLRALGPRLPAVAADARAALARLAADPSFRTRYLLLEPAALLAASEPTAAGVLGRGLSADSDPRLRARALELAPRTAAYGPAFVAALAAGDVRVREAAAYALGEGPFAQSSHALSELLEDDAWPIARRAAAVSLGRFPDEPTSRATLLDALDDPAPWVRAAAAESLGLRRSPGAAEPLRDRLEDREERIEVRRAAALSLGALCDGDSIDLLDKLARRLSDPLSSVEDRAIGEASLEALVRIHPADLEQRLQPLLKGGTAKAVTRARTRSGSGCAPRR